MAYTATPPCETDTDDDLLRCQYDRDGYCDAVESDDVPILFDMLSGQHRCEQHFPWDHVDG